MSEEQKPQKVHNNIAWVDAFPIVGEILEKTELTLSELSVKIGMSESYLSKCAASGEIKVTSVLALKHIQDTLLTKKTEESVCLLIVGRRKKTGLVATMAEELGCRVMEIPFPGQ